MNLKIKKKLKKMENIYNLKKFSNNNSILYFSSNTLTTVGQEKYILLKIKI